MDDLPKPENENSDFPADMPSEYPPVPPVAEDASISELIPALPVAENGSVSEPPPIAETEPAEEPPVAAQTPEPETPWYATAAIEPESPPAAVPPVATVTTAAAQPLSDTPPVTAIGTPPAPPVVSTTKPAKKSEKRGSIFFPFLLIAIGFVLLLQNLHLISMDVWSTLISLWPLLFIAGGLDGLWRGEGLTSAVFSLGIGTIFLLGNFGILTFSPWQVIITTWPVLLVAIGYDILIGRRKTIWTTLLGLVMVVALMAGVLYMSGVGVAGGLAVGGDRVEVGLQGATRAEIIVSPGAGSVVLNQLVGSDALLAGRVPTSTSHRTITQEFTKTGDTARLALRMLGSNVIISPRLQDQLDWILGVTPSVPLDLKLSSGAGEADLDLTGLNISNLDVELGAGLLTIRLPETGNFPVKISNGVGQVTLIVPAGMEILIRDNTALVGKSIPPELAKGNNRTYASPGYGSSENQVQITIDLAVGTLIVRQE